MNLVNRAKGIIMRPSQEWALADTEQVPPADLYKGYVIPLAAIGPVASFIGMVAVGVSVPFIGTVRMPVGSSLLSAILSFVFALAGVLIVALVINALAPRFGAGRDFDRALKVAAYAYTPVWVAGILSIIPALGVLILLASLYGLYLLHLGIKALMRPAEDKALTYSVLVVVCAFVMSLVLGGITGAVAALSTPTAIPDLGVAEMSVRGG